MLGERGGHQLFHLAARDRDVGERAGGTGSLLTFRPELARLQADLSLAAIETDQRPEFLHEDL